MLILWQFVVLGLSTGGAYALAAVGVVTIFRGSGVLNFAHGAMGMVGTYAFWEVYRGGDGSWAALPSAVFGIAFGAALGAAVYLLVMRPLRRSVELARLVASLGVLLTLQSIALIRYGATVVSVPALFFTGFIRLPERANLSENSLLVLVAVVVLAIAISVLFRRTKLGLSAIALQERPDATGFLGISPTPTGVVVWSLGGALASAAGIVLLPIIGLAPGQLTLVIFPAFAAALLGRFRNFPVTIGAALAIGVFESVLVLYQWPATIVNAVPFAIIILALVIGGTSIPGRGLTEARLPRLGDGVIRVKTVGVVFVASLLSILTLGIGWSGAFASSAIAAIITLSFVVATGYTGQITLAPFALAGAASLVTAWISNLGVTFLVAVSAGVVTAAVGGAIVALPSIRVRGVDLAIATLGFALVIQDTLLNNPSVTGGFNGIPLTAASLFGYSISPFLQPQRFAIVCLVLILVTCVGVANLRRGRAGRRFAGVRSNERGAASLGISITSTKIGAFAISGALAGLGGSLLTYGVSNASFGNFGVSLSILALGYAIVGGIGFTSGALFAGVVTAGGLFSYFLRDYSSLDEWLSLGGGLFVIQVMLLNPDGQVDLLAKQFRQIVRALKKTAAPALRSSLFRRLIHSDLDHDAYPAIRDSTQVPAERVLLVERQSRPNGEALTGTSLTVKGLSVDYGQVRAIDNVHFELLPGSVLGVVGPNGAGKTTLIDAITGFCRTQSGEILLGKTEVGQWSAVKRARNGLGRTFQNLELFVDLTVRENLLAASDRRDTWAFASNFIRPGSRELSGWIDSCVDLLGIGSFLESAVDELPQGSQRLVAIARAVAIGPKVVCLDEPTAGLNGHERILVSKAIRTIVDELSIAALLIEHNVDVVSSVCDRTLALDFGRIIAEGPTQEVLQSDQVRAAYMGQFESDVADESGDTSLQGPS